MHIRGLVQGVCFRASTRDRAQLLGLVGWVRNEPDGSVVVEAQGPAHAVGQLIEWCGEGPAAARVDSFDAGDVDIRDADTDFSIRR